MDKIKNYNTTSQVIKMLKQLQLMFIYYELPQSKYDMEYEYRFLRPKSTLVREAALKITIKLANMLYTQAKSPLRSSFILTESDFSASLAKSLSSLPIAAIFRKNDFQIELSTHTHVI